MIALLQSMPEKEFLTSVNTMSAFLLTIKQPAISKYIYHIKLNVLILGV